MADFERAKTIEIPDVMKFSLLKYMFEKNNFLSAFDCHNLEVGTCVLMWMKIIKHYFMLIKLRNVG